MRRLESAGGGKDRMEGKPCTSIHWISLVVKLNHTSYSLPFKLKNYSFSRSSFPSFHRNQDYKNIVLKNAVYITFFWHLNNSWQTLHSLFFFFNQMLTPNSTFWSQNNLSVELFNLKVLSYWSYICSRTLLHTENCRHSWKVSNVQRNTCRDLAI